MTEAEDAWYDLQGTKLSHSPWPADWEKVSFYFSTTYCMRSEIGLGENESCGARTLVARMKSNAFCKAQIRL